jgi:TonB family protein
MKLVLLFLMTFAATVLAEKPAPDIQRPVPVKKTEPLYTEEARLAGVEGTVLVSAQLDEKGRLSDMKVVKGLGYGLDENAIDCVRQWQFRPAMRNGEPVPTKVFIGVNFRLPRPR